MKYLVIKAMVKYYTKKSLLSPSQHGFSHDQSCLTNLLETFAAWIRILDDGYGLDVIFLDHRKAFDTVPHRQLPENYD